MQKIERAKCEICGKSDGIILFRGKHVCEDPINGCTVVVLKKNNRKIKNEKSLPHIPDGEAEIMMNRIRSALRCREMGFSRIADAMDIHRSYIMKEGNKWNRIFSRMINSGEIIDNGKKSRARLFRLA